MLERQIWLPINSLVIRYRSGLRGKFIALRRRAINGTHRPAFFASCAPFLLHPRRLHFSRLSGPFFCSSFSLALLGSTSATVSLLFSSRHLLGTRRSWLKSGWNYQRALPCFFPSRSFLHLLWILGPFETSRPSSFNTCSLRPLTRSVFLFDDFSDLSGAQIFLFVLTRFTIWNYRMTLIAKDCQSLHKFRNKD